MSLMIAPAIAVGVQAGANCPRYMAAGRCQRDEIATTEL